MVYRIISLQSLRVATAGVLT